MIRESRERETHIWRRRKRRGSRISVECIPVDYLKEDRISVTVGMRGEERGKRIGRGAYPFSSGKGEGHLQPFTHQHNPEEREKLGLYLYPISIFIRCVLVRLRMKGDEVIQGGYCILL